MLPAAKSAYRCFLLSRADGGEEAISRHDGPCLPGHTSVTGELEDLCRSQKQLETVYKATYFRGEVLEDSCEIDYGLSGHMKDNDDEKD
jgi:hypothetical protein